MNTGTWIAVYLPLIFIFLIMIPEKNRKIYMARLLKKRKGERNMTNEMIMSLIGETCDISTGSLDSAYSAVKVVDVVENWIKVEKKGKSDLINIDYVQGIKIRG